jgi:cytochrome c-type biogenesis protein CcmF
VLNPLIMWLWIGGIVMGLGTVLAMFPGRKRRLATDAASAPIPEPHPHPEPDPVLA